MALREAILQSLSCMLSANTDIRKLAEERMNALEVTDGKEFFFYNFVDYFHK